jgi:hypothetical protein
MEINGRIIELLPEKSGESANGLWRKQEYILETDGQYPKRICFMAWGNKIDQFGIKQGENLVISVDLESREYNGRWYTDVKAWKISREDASSHADVQPQSPISVGKRDLVISEDDIPFLDDEIPF